MSRTEAYAVLARCAAAEQGREWPKTDRLAEALLVAREALLGVRQSEFQLTDNKQPKETDERENQ